MSRLSKLDILSVCKYFDTIDDFKNLVFVNKKFRDIPEYFKFNPIPLLVRSIRGKLSLKKDVIYFPKIETLYIYNRVLYSEREEIAKRFNIPVSFRNFELSRIYNPKTEHYDIDVPYEEKDIPHIKKINNGYFSYSDIKEIVFYNLESIGINSFCNCKFLTKVELQYVEKVKRFAFYRCENLVCVNLPNVRSVGENAFEDCISLTEINMPKVEIIKESSFSNCRRITKLEFENVLTIDRFAFYECESLIEIDLPKVEHICENAFRPCRLLKIVNIPNVKTIEGSFCGINRFQVFNAPNILLQNL